MTIGEYINAYLLEHQMSQRQFAKKCNFSNGYISMLINNLNPKTGKPLVPSLTALLSIARAMGVTLDELINAVDDMDVDISAARNLFAVERTRDRAHENSSVQNLPANVQSLRTYKIPLLGDIACGEPIFADEQREMFVEVSEDIKADFCLKAKGDSMINARINNGDIVFIKSQSIVDNGEIAAVIIEDEATLKRVYYYPQSNKVVLSPENPRYEPLIYEGEELDRIRILGKAVAFQSLIE